MSDSNAQFFLFYAGMTMDPDPIEQIGLAVSRDGRNFQRIGSDGLLLARDTTSNWHNVHVCNPTVVRDERSQEWLMFYQGVGWDGHRNSTSIALARSTALDHWSHPKEPFLQLADLNSILGAAAGVGGVGLIEPAVVEHNGIWHLWFVAVHPSVAGNALFHASSKDCSNWEIDTSPIVTGHELGRFRLHYPHVRKTSDQWTLWLTLIDERYGGHGMFASAPAESPLGPFAEFHQVLPRPTQSVPSSLKPNGLALPMFTITGGEPRAASLIKRSWNASARRAAYYLGSTDSAGLVRGKWGMAHPHVTEYAGRDFFYFHWCNSSPRGLQLDIGMAVLENGQGATSETVLSAGARGKWDDFFVADPFVLLASSAS